MDWTLASAFLLLAALVTFLGVIDIKHEARVPVQDSICTVSFGLYVGMMLLANGATSIAAWPMVEYARTSGTAAFVKAGHELGWAVVLGVFGFQAVLKKLNLAFSEQTLFNFDVWAAKARDNAVADAIASAAARDKRSTCELAERLRKLGQVDLNGYVTQYLGAQRVAQLDQLANANNADPSHIKAYALASDAKDHARALVSTLPQPSAE